MSKALVAGVLTAVIAVGGVGIALAAGKKATPCGPIVGNCSTALCISASQSAVVAGGSTELSVTGAQASGPVTFQYITAKDATPTTIGTVTADTSGAASYTWTPTLNGSYVVYATTGACESGNLAISVTGGTETSEITLSVTPAVVVLGAGNPQTFQAALSGTPGHDWVLWLLESPDSIVTAQQVTGAEGTGTFPTNGTSIGSIAATQVLDYAETFDGVLHRSYSVYVIAQDVQGGVYSNPVQVTVAIGVRFPPPP